MNNKNWKVAEFKVVVGTRTYLQVAECVEDFMSWPDMDTFVRWVGTSNDVVACQDWLDRTGWVQDEVSAGKFPLSALGKHRADVMHEEIERLRYMEKMGEGQIDNALATFLATHTNLGEDGIDQKAMSLALALNYAALHPVPKEEVQQWISSGYNPQALMFDDPECDGTDAAHPAFHRGCDHALLVLVGKIEEILDGKDTGIGTANYPWEAARQRMIKLVRARQDVLDLCNEATCDDDAGQEALDHLRSMIRITYDLEG